jgi:chromate transporter
MMLLRLYWEFFQVGLFAVGGGLATLPFLYSLGTRTGWFTTAQVADMLAVSESTPGPIGVNMATYVGFTAGGIPGAVIATLGLVAPSYLVILLVCRVLEKTRNNPWVDSVFTCLRPVSTALITAAGLSVAALVLLRPAETLLGRVDWRAVVMAALLVALTRFIPQTRKLHPLVWILLSAGAGLLFF